MSEIKQKIANPVKFYKHPSEVEFDSSLTNQQKLTLLLNWQNDENLKLIAAEENMLPSHIENKSLLPAIEKLIRLYSDEN